MPGTAAHSNFVTICGDHDFYYPNHMNYYDCREATVRFLSNMNLSKNNLKLMNLYEYLRAPTGVYFAKNI